MLERAVLLRMVAKRRDLCQERHVEADGEQLGVPDRGIRSVKPVSTSGQKSPKISAYLANSLTVDLLSTALSLCPQEEGHLVRGSCVR